MVTLRRLAFFFLLAPLSVSAQDVLYQTSFDDGDGFVVLSGSDDVFHEFGYEYSSFDGIPEAPNSDLTGGDPHLGLRMEANLSAGQVTEILAVTEGLDLSGRFEVSLDVWLNYNYPAGASGTTEYGGLGVGHDGEFPGFDGATFIYDTDGDSGSDYILWKNFERQAADSGQYAIPSLNNTEDVFTEAFPPINLEEAVPEQFLFGETPAGTGGFRWMTITALVDTDAIGPAGITDDPGIATFTLTDANTGNSVEIGTIDNSNDGELVNLSGDVSIVFTDLFTSVSNNESLSFGLFDNLIVTTVVDTSDPLDCNMDGVVDTGDVDCATAETIADTLDAAGVIPGDLNFSGGVDFSDFLILSGNFGDPAAGSVYANGDINLSGGVDFPDFLTLSSNFGLSAAAAAVPEPATGLLFGIALVGCGAFRRRRS